MNSKKKSLTKVSQFLNSLNEEYHKLHRVYENFFWTSYMGDHSVDVRLNKALNARDAFRANTKYARLVEKYLSIKTITADEKTRLGAWKLFFGKYQISPKVLALKKQISQLETKVQKAQSKVKEGYHDPYTKKFIPASRQKLGFLMATNADEKIRKACFEGREKRAPLFANELVQLVKLRNKFAHLLGFEDFYAYKIKNEEGMTKQELFKIFDSIYKKTAPAFKKIRDLEKKQPGLRKPWNFGYMMAGDFTKEEDPYFQFKDALLYWGRSFMGLGADFQGGALQLDLAERKGKYNNGFCHWPKLVHFKDGKRIPGASNFTCNGIPGQIGSGKTAISTLFHEGGHALHYLNSEQTEVCLNTEYPPASTAWAETQSMFMDTMFSSIEWVTRYAKNTKGQTYPLDLFRRKLDRLFVLQPLSFMGYIQIPSFERRIYSEKKLSRARLLSIAREEAKKHHDLSEESLIILSVPHLYSWESACSYHGYGLAKTAVAQWRDYFYKKYGYIVDNANIAREMKKVWALGSSKTFKECVKIATGKALTPGALVENITASKATVIKRSKSRMERLKKVPAIKKPVQLNAFIRMVDGKKTVSDNKKSFEDMARRFGEWLSKKEKIV